MPRRHVVKQGECLSSIARKYGFLSWRTIYDAPDNSDFRKKRPNPNVIYPGDKLAIPDPPGGDGFVATLGTGQTQQAVVEREPTLLRLKVLDHLGGKGEAAAYELEVEGLPGLKEGDVGQSGEVEVAIPEFARKGRITLKSKSSGEVIKVFDLLIGDLDPVTTPSGLRERLRRLGYDPGPEPAPYQTEKEDDEIRPQVESALRAFQSHFGLQETGTPNEETRNKLVDLTGA